MVQKTPGVEARRGVVVKLLKKRVFDFRVMIYCRRFLFIGLHEQAVFGAIVEQLQVWALSLAVLAARHVDESSGYECFPHRLLGIHPVMAILCVRVVDFKDGFDEGVRVLGLIIADHHGQIGNGNPHGAAGFEHTQKFF